MAKNIFSAMKQKKPKVVDPNAPPRPTLLGHEKEMKTWREQFKSIAQNDHRQAVDIALLQRKINRLESQLDAMVSYLNRKNK